MLGQARVAGVTVLPLLAPTTVQLSVLDQVTIFDGVSSEMVTIGVAAPIGTSSLTILAPGLQYAHGQYALMCSDGIGSLAQTIINASSELEAICKQPLLSATYTETYALQTMQASIDSIGTLNIRTPHLPITALTSVVLNSDIYSGQVIPLTTTKFKGQLVSTLGTGLSQRLEGDIDVTYTAGFPYAQLPPKIKQACIWLVSDILRDRINSSGAAIVYLGQSKIQQRLKDETESELYTRARTALYEYTVKVSI